MVANTLARETLREALVATYVWGKGKSGSPGGSGPATLHKILAAAASARYGSRHVLHGAPAHL